MHFIFNYIACQSLLSNNSKLYNKNCFIPKRIFYCAKDLARKQSIVDLLYFHSPKFTICIYLQKTKKLETVFETKKIKAIDIY